VFGMMPNFRQFPGFNNWGNTPFIGGEFPEKLGLTRVPTNEQRQIPIFANRRFSILSKPGFRSEKFGSFSGLKNLLRCPESIFKSRYSHCEFQIILSATYE
jgi:hypothetical protein